MGPGPMSRRPLFLCLVLSLPAVLVHATPTPTLDDALARAQALLERGDRGGARSELMRALRSFPSHPLLQNFLGVVEAQDDHYPAAEAAFREAVRAAPRFTEAFLNLGRLYQENAARDPGAVRKGLATYEAVLAYEPLHAESLYQSAVLLQATGDFASSLERLSRLPQDQQERAQVLAVRLAGELGAGHRAAAERAADALLARPDLAEADVLTILPALAAHGGSDLGLRLLERVRARGLISAEGLQRLGTAYQGAGQLNAARDALEAAAAARPDSVAVLLDLARVAQQARDLRGALGYLAHARELDPKDARVHFLFGMVCVELDLGVEAYNSLKEAVRLDPGNAAINYAMGAVCLHRRDPTEAVPFFRRYAELEADDPRGALAVGMAWFKAGEFAAARPELARAAKSPQTAAAAHYFLARIAREENDLDRALELVEKALAADPSYADAWAERGLLHLRKREREPAERDLQRCLELEPDNFLGNLHLLALYQRTRDARQEAQEKRIEELKVLREQKAEEFRRVIEVRPN
jgi:tetratricopeptide (TPR) repeat protein